MELNDLIKSGVQKSPVKLLLYGQNKIGKTTFAAESPSPVFIPIENGLRGFDVPRFPQPVELAELYGFLKLIRESDKFGYKTVVFDSLDWLEKLIHDDICRRKGKQSIGDVPHGAGYAESVKMLSGILTGLDSLIKQHGFNVIFIAHEKIVEKVCPVNGSYTSYSVNCSDKFAGLVFDWCDFNGYCHKELRIVSDQHGMGQTTKRVGHESDRLLSFEQTAKFRAGARVPRGAEFPIVMPLDAAEFWSKI